MFNPEYAEYFEKYPEPELQIMGCDLHLTCGACPEQYDVFLHGVQIGYLRLRHGHFTATSPDVGGKLVYSAAPAGDGVFEAHERMMYLEEAVAKLLTVGMD